MEGGPSSVGPGLCEPVIPVPSPLRFSPIERRGHGPQRSLTYAFFTPYSGAGKCARGALKHYGRRV